MFSFRRFNLRRALGIQYATGVETWNSREEVGSGDNNLRVDSI